MLSGLASLFAITPTLQVLTVPNQAPPSPPHFLIARLLLAVCGDLY